MHKNLIPTHKIIDIIGYGRSMRLLIIGYGRHGKDTVSEYLEKQHGMTFESSSKFCSKKFIFNDLKDKYGYDTEEECYADRHNHRSEWYDAICNYNKDDAAKLGKEMFDEFDIYCGLRNKREFDAMKNEKVFDYSIWVDRSDHLPPEDSSSISLEQCMSDYTIDNNGSIDELYKNVDALLASLR